MGNAKASVCGISLLLLCFLSSTAQGCRSFRHRQSVAQTLAKMSSYYDECMPKSWSGGGFMFPALAMSPATLRKRVRRVYRAAYPRDSFRGGARGKGCRYHRRNVIDTVVLAPFAGSDTIVNTATRMR